MRLLKRWLGGRKGAELRRGDPLDESEIAFLICVEANRLEPQARLLCESLRTFGGRYRNAPILAVSPRPPLALGPEARARLDDLGVTYVVEPLNDDRQPLWRDQPHRGRRLGRNLFFTALPRHPRYGYRPGRRAEFRARGCGGQAGGRQGCGVERSRRSAGCLLGPHVRARGDRSVAPAQDRHDDRSRADPSLLQQRFHRGPAGSRHPPEDAGDLLRVPARKTCAPWPVRGSTCWRPPVSSGSRPSEWWGSSQAALSVAIWSRTTDVYTYDERYNIPLHNLMGPERSWPMRPGIPAHPAALSLSGGGSSTGSGSGRC